MRHRPCIQEAHYLLRESKNRQLDYNGVYSCVKGILMNLFQNIKIIRADALSCSLPNPQNLEKYLLTAST